MVFGINQFKIEFFSIYTVVIEYFFQFGVDDPNDLKVALKSKEEIKQSKKEQSG